MKKLIRAAVVAGAFAVTPAFADEAVVVPDNRDASVIHENEHRSDGPVIIEKDRPADAVIVDHDRHYSNGGSSGEIGVGVGGVGVDIETHSHDRDPR